MKSLSYSLACEIKDRRDMHVLGVSAQIEQDLIGRGVVFRF